MVCDALKKSFYGTLCASALLCVSCQEVSKPTFFEDGEAPRVWVNGVMIEPGDLRASLRRVAKTRADLHDSQVMNEALRRLVRDELLVQEGIKLGLYRTNPEIQAMLREVLFDRVMSEMVYTKPSAEELQRYYQDNKQFFAYPGPVSFRALRFVPRADDSAASTPASRAQEAYTQARAGKSFEAIGEALGAGPWEPPLPDGPLTHREIIDRIGPAATQVLYTMGSGEVSKPLNRLGTWFVLQVVERRAGHELPYDRIKHQVAGHHRSAAKRRLIDAYLDNLRAGATIDIVDGSL